MTEQNKSPEAVGAAVPGANGFPDFSTSDYSAMRRTGGCVVLGDGAMKCHGPRFSPRQLRALEALLNGPTTREAIDRAAGASNGPNVIFRLRQKGFDLPCDLQQGCDRDGKPCRFGVYRLTATDADKAREILRRVPV